MDVTRIPLLLALLASVGPLAAAPAGAKPPKCPGGRYLVVGDHIVGDPEAGLVDILQLDGRMLSIESGCEVVKARVRATAAGTKVVARWKSCDGVAAKGRLKGTITEYCRTFTGTFSARKLQMTKPFIAALSACGDGIWDAAAGEECDGDLGPCGSFCNACRCGGVTTTTGPTTTTIEPTTTSSTTSPTSSTSTTTGAPTSTTTSPTTTTTATTAPASTTTTTAGATTTTTAGGTTTTTPSTTTTTGAPTTTTTTTPVTTTTATSTTTTSTTSTSTTTVTTTTAPAGSTTTTFVPMTTTTTTTTTLVGPDLYPTVFTPSSFSVIAGVAVAVSFTVKNQGTATAVNPWWDYVWFSTDAVFNNGDDSVLGYWQRTSNVAVNGTYTQMNKTITIPDVPPGTYRIFLETDGFHELAESLENNNVKGPVALTVTAPDLLPTAFSGPGSAASGATIAVSYTVKNQGNANAVPSWSDRVFLSTNNVFDGGDTQIGAFTRSSALAANATYTLGQNVTLPGGLPPATYYLFFQTDAAGQVAEGGQDANNVSSAVPISIS